MPLPQSPSSRNGERRGGFGLRPQSLRTLRALKTPARIQRFIDGLQYQYANTAWSPERVLRERKGHCLEGAVLAAAALRPGQVTVDNLQADDLQGERAALDVLIRMGADLERSGDAVTVRGGRALHGVVEDGDPFTDAVQALCAAAALAEGTTIWHNVATLRLKECDRISDTRAELRKLGVDCDEGEDRLILRGKPAIEGGVCLDSHGDHRMVMMLCALGLAAQRPVVIAEPQHIAKSYPDFFGHLRALGAQLEVSDS